MTTGYRMVDGECALWELEFHIWKWEELKQVDWFD